MFQNRFFVCWVFCLFNSYSVFSGNFIYDIDVEVSAEDWVNKLFFELIETNRHLNNWDTQTWSPERTQAFKEYLFALRAPKIADLPNTLSRFHDFSIGKFVRGTVCTSQLVRSPDWTWNQSRKKFVLNTDNSKVTFWKLSGRLVQRFKKVTEQKPAFKLWVFNISTPLMHNYSFLWLERADPRYLPQGTSLGEELLNDFSFLAEFNEEESQLNFGDNFEF